MSFVSVESLLRGQTAAMFPPKALRKGFDPVKRLVTTNRRLFGRDSLVIDDPLAIVYNVRDNANGKTSGRALSIHVGLCPFSCAGCYVDHEKNEGRVAKLLRTMKANQFPEALVAVPQSATTLDAYIENRMQRHVANNGGSRVTYSGGETLTQRGWLVGNLTQMKAAGRRTSIDTMGLAPALVPDYFAPFADAGLQDDIIFHLSSKPVMPQSFTQLTGNTPNNWPLALLGTMQAFHDGFLVAPTGPIDNFWSGPEILQYYALLKAIDPELPRVARSVTWTVAEAFSQNADQARAMVRHAGLHKSTDRILTYKDGARSYIEHKSVFRGAETQRMIPKVIQAVSGYEAIKTTPENPAINNTDYLACLNRIRTRLMAQDLNTIPIHLELRRIVKAGADAPAEELMVDPEVAPIDPDVLNHFAQPFQRRTNIFPT